MDLEPKNAVEDIWPDPDPDIAPEPPAVGAWVNDNSYNPGKRHYIPAGVTRTTQEPYTRNGYRYHPFNDAANGPSLCSQSPRFAQSSGYVLYDEKTGKRFHGHGGLSVKEKVNLLQRNLCSYCLKRYIAERPELKAAVEAVQRAQVMS